MSSSEHDLVSLIEVCNQKGFDRKGLGTALLRQPCKTAIVTPVRFCISSFLLNKMHCSMLWNILTATGLLEGPVEGFYGCIHVLNGILL